MQVVHQIVQVCMQVDVTHALLKSAPRCINKPFTFFNVQVYLLENTLETVDQAGIPHKSWESSMPQREAFSLSTAKG